MKAQWLPFSDSFVYERLAMNAQFICHSDFESNIPMQVFHKEMSGASVQDVPKGSCNRHVLFRRKATLGMFKRAILRITADDYYKLYINEAFVTMGPAPAYPQAYYYNELDVTALLREGENTLAVHTYYQGLRNRVWVSGDGRQMLWLELELDGKVVLVSDTDWKCTLHTGYSARGIYGYETAFAEHYDSRAKEVGFEKETYDDGDWGNACVWTHADYTLIKQPTKQLEIYNVAPANCKPVESGLLWDVGRETVGYFCPTVKGRRGQVLTLRYGEELDASGRVRWQMRCNCDYEEAWTLSGGKDVLNNYDYKAFRYVEALSDEPFEVLDANMTVRHYPYREVATYSVAKDHPELQRVLRLCADTVKYGTQEVFVDCPTREKGQYLGDVSIAARAHAVLTGNTGMMKKAIRNFCDSTFICPGMMAVSTSSLMQEIADYSLQFAAQVLWLYRTDGDLEFLKQTEPYVAGIYQHFLQFVNRDGLLERVTDKWNLVDWPQNLRDGYDFELTKPIGEGVHNVINAFWCGFLEAYDEILVTLGKAPTGRTESTKNAYVCAFYRKSTGLFHDTPTSEHAAMHSNVLPLLFEIGTEDACVKKRLIGMIRERGLSSMGVYMAYFTLAALVKHGEHELAVELATDPHCWLLMLDEGATATFEAWGKDQKWNTSLCHPWATAPLIVFADGVLPY